MGASTGAATGSQAAGGTSSQLASAGAGIATGLATGGPIGGLIATGLAATSFIQANKQMKLQREAEQNAAKALEEAKRQININPFAALGIQKEPYELEREALLSQGAQAIAAGQEGDRGAAATAGRIQMAQNEAQAGQRAAMQKEMSDLEKLTAEEQADIKTQLAGVSLEEAEGYNKESQDAAKARAMAIQQGYETGAKALKYGLEQVPLYLQGRKSEAEKNMENIGMPSVTPPSQRVIPGASSPIQFQNLNASTPSQNYVMQNQGKYNAFNSPFMQQMNPFLF